MLPSTASGVAAAACLGLGRALGEAIAVTQVIGAGTVVHSSLFRTGDTLASRIAHQFPGATEKLHTSALFYLAVILLVIGARHEPARAVDRPPLRRSGGAGRMTALDRTGALRPDRAAHRVRQPARRRRQPLAGRRSWCAVLARRARGGRAGDLVGRCRARAGALSLDFLTKSPPLFGGPGGGIAPAIVGTAVIVVAATLIALPIGVLVAIFLTEFAGPARPRPSIRLALDLLNGLPSIVVGLFVFGLLVVGHHQSGFAGAGRARDHHAAADRARGAGDAAARPDQLREAADALGVSRWRTIVGVVLPERDGRDRRPARCSPIARAAGETAPLIFTSLDLRSNQVTRRTSFGQAMPNIPVLDLHRCPSRPTRRASTRAWGAGARPAHVHPAWPTCARRARSPHAAAASWEHR